MLSFINKLIKNEREVEDSNVIYVPPGVGKILDFSIEYHGKELARATALSHLEDRTFDISYHAKRLDVYRYFRKLHEKHKS